MKMTTIIPHIILAFAGMSQLLAQAGAGVNTKPSDPAEWRIHSDEEKGRVMLRIAENLAWGLEGKVDPAMAIDWLQGASDIGNATAQYYLANQLSLGHAYLAPAPQEAMRLYTLSAEAGYAPAQTRLGTILLKGLLGQPKNEQKAFEWLREAMNQYDAQAMFQLAHQILLATQDPDDVRTALRYMEQAAELNNAPAWRQLGHLYEFGHHLLPLTDIQKARHCYEQGAELGDTNCLGALGRLTIGEKIPATSDADSTLAMERITEAARLGDHESLSVYGMTWLMGIYGSPKNTSLAMNAFYAATLRGWPQGLGVIATSEDSKLDSRTTYIYIRTSLKLSNKPNVAWHTTVARLAASVSPEELAAMDEEVDKLVAYLNELGRLLEEYKELPPPFSTERVPQAKQADLPSAPDLAAFFDTKKMLMNTLMPDPFYTTSENLLKQRKMPPFLRFYPFRVKPLSPCPPGFAPLLPAGVPSAPLDAGKTQKNKE